MTEGAFSEEVGEPSGNYTDLTEDIITNGCGNRFKGDKAKAVWTVINELLRRGHYEASIKRLLLDRKNRISEHVHEQANPEKYVDAQIEKAISKITIAVGESGKPSSSQGNIRVALLKLGIRVKHDRFADRTLISGLPDFGPAIDDAAVDRLWLLIDQRFRFRPTKEVFYTVIQDTARLNQFHPVRDFLDGLKWDGKQRIDKWLSTYGKAKSSKYVDAVGALILIAAVRRIRQPGCKFDEMLVLEAPQGQRKSEALSVLAIHDDWFSDDLPLNADSKRVIETLHGRWIIEAAELSGMKRADIEHLKAFLARRIDRARMAYGRMVAEYPRQCVIFGTTNAHEYLRDTTGNRRVWPVAIQKFDIEALKRDVNQLWAEAAEREARGDSIRLDPSLWEAAGAEQKDRTTEDPYYEMLWEQLDGKQGKVTTESLWQIIGERSPDARGQEKYSRIAEAMQRLGWTRPKNRVINVDGGKKVSGFVKGREPRKLIKPDF